MRQAFHLWLLHLYPIPWRERYGEEFAAVLDDAPLSPLLFCDVLLGALDARLHLVDLTGRTWTMLTRLRSSAVTVFGAYIAFVLAGLALNGMLDDSPYIKLMSARADLADAYLAIEAGAIVALLAVVVGGLPIAWSIWRNSPAQRRLFAIPIICFLLVVGLPIALIILVQTNVISPRGTSLNGAGPMIILGYQIVFILAAIASTAAVVRAVGRGAVSETTFRFARVPEAIAAIAMIAMTIATLVWGIAAAAALPEQFLSWTLRVPLYPSALSWLLIVVIMSVSAAIASRAALRNFANDNSPSPALA